MYFYSGNRLEDPYGMMALPPSRPSTPTPSLMQPRRLRLSVWADPQVVTPNNIGRVGNGIIDDISLLRTISNDDAVNSRYPLQLTFDRMFLPGQIDTRHRSAYEGMVRLCHSKGIQILAGYGVVTEKRIGKRLNDWLRNSKRSPTFDEYARRIVHFLLSLSLDPSAPILDAQGRFDGLSLDIETLEGDLGNQFTEFCQVLATHLAQQSMLLAVAAGGMISEEDASQTPADPKTGKRPTLLKALPSARATQYKMGLGHPNILIRPMAYDINLSGRSLARWHGEIIDWATGGVGLPPSQFQLGVKSVHGGLNAGITEAPHEVEQRCSELLRPKSVGLIVFALGKSARWDFWDRYDRALNRGVRAAGSFIGQPLQGPLDAKALTRLTPALSPMARRSMVRVAQTR